jgi:hypothetical protein
MSNAITVSIVTTLVTILVVGVILAVMRHRDHDGKRWRCTEGKCEMDINGAYMSKSACQDACKPDMNAWACAADGQCVKSDQGYTSKELCQQNCVPPNVGYDYPVYPYYPQSLLWWPRYRGWRRGGGRR